jgi:2-dehydropantoate 2-reductase
MASISSIAILGLGGVGGYIGGKLAGHFSNSKDVRIVFFARGENERAIASNGLKLITAQGEQVVHPSLVTSRPGDLGQLDLIICTIKSYDLETSIASLRPCVTGKTIILHLLNGVDARERIISIFPRTEIWDGCIYIVSRLIAPGVVRESGNINRIFFGSDHADMETLKYVETTFSSAGINARISDNITQTIWEKFLFISPIASLTSYLDLPMGKIMGDKSHAGLMLNLLSEVKSVADAQHIPLPENILQTTFERMKSLAPESTSSMHSDFQKGKNTEVDSLTGYVVRLGKELNIATPHYENVLAALKEKSVK